MPLRERLRKTFSRSDSSSDSSSFLSRTMTNDSQEQSRRDSSVYQPGEKMPPLKYRRPVAKEHKERLEAFDFATAWRRRSHHSIYSPHGSRQASRAPSAVDMSNDVAAALKNHEQANELLNDGSDTSVNDASTDDGSSLSPATSSAASDVLVDRVETWTFS